MIRVRPRLPRFCMGRGTARVRTRSPPQQQQQQYNRSYSSIKTDELITSEFSSKNSTEMNYNGDNSSELCGNRVMIVVDSSLEAKGALHWALSHTVQSQDTIILMHVLVTNKSSRQGMHLYIIPYSFRPKMTVSFGLYLFTRIIYRI